MSPHVDVFLWLGSTSAKKIYPKCNMFTYILYVSVYIYGLSVYVYMSIYEYICMYVCVLYVCVCVLYVFSKYMPEC